MAREGVEILEDDEEADLAAFMLEACGIESRDFYHDERVLTRENFEKNYYVLEKMVKVRQPKEIIFGKAPYFEIGRAPYFVIGYLALLTGAKIPEKMRQNILEAARWEHEAEYWLDEDFAVTRKAYLKDFREKISIHKPSQRLHTATFCYSGKDFLNSKVVVGIKQFREMCKSKELHKIIHLNLDGWNLESIPDEIFQIPNLKSLSLEHNQISKLTQRIYELKRLKRLDLDYNYITELPEAIGDLESLVSLNIMHNNIACLPVSIKNLRNLRYVYVRGTRITEAPKFLQNSKFDELNQTIYISDKKKN